MRLRFRPRVGARGEMNKLEEAFADELIFRRRSGELVWWEREPFKLRLAKNTFYTPDFASLDQNGELCIYEVKGFWEDDARVKTKVAAAAFPMFRFVGVTRARGEWKWEEF